MFYTEASVSEVQASASELRHCTQNMETSILNMEVSAFEVQTSASELRLSAPNMETCVLELRRSVFEAQASLFGQSPWMKSPM